MGWASQIVGKRSDPGVSVGAADEVPIFKCLAAGWVDDDVGLFFLMDYVAEGGYIQWLCSAFPAVVGSLTGLVS